MSNQIEIYAAINRVMEKFTAIHKDGSVGYGNNSYKVVTYDNIIGKIRQHFVEEHIIVNPRQIDRGVYTEGKTQKGGIKFRYDALYDVEFISSIDGSTLVSRIEVSSESFGDDKAPSKATTIAVKNAILKVFSLESSDEVADEIKNIITDKQFHLLHGLVVSTGVDQDKFIAYYNAPTLKEFPETHYQKAIDQLQKKTKVVK